MADVKEMTYWRLRPPTPARTLGQGPGPPGLSLGISGRRYVIPWGLVVRASATCDPEGGVANLDHSPPLVRAEIIAKHIGQFEPVGADHDTED